MEIFNSDKQNEDYLKLVKKVRDSFSGLTISAFIIHGLERDYVDVVDFSRELTIISESNLDAYREKAIEFLYRLSVIQSGIQGPEFE